MLVPYRDLCNEDVRLVPMSRAAVKQLETPAHLYLPVSGPPAEQRITVLLPLHALFPPTLSTQSLNFDTPLRLDG